MPADAASQPADHELVRWIAAGYGSHAEPRASADAQARSAEAELCRRFAPRIRLYGLRHLRDHERARDLVQTVLTAVLQAARAGRIEDPERLERFVLGTCRNCTAQMRRVEGRVEPLAHEPIAALSMPGTELLDKRALMRCFDRLDTRAKQVVLMSFQQERSADEIAGELAITAVNVRVLRHRALAALRRCLDGGAGASA